jgi:hypothetical protein
MTMLSEFPIKVTVDKLNDKKGEKQCNIEIYFGIN